MQVVIRPHLLSTREMQTIEGVDYGMSVAEVCARLKQFDERVKKFNLACLIDGQVVPKREWRTRRLQYADRKVEFAVVLHGGGKAKQILGIVAMIALTAVSGGAAAALGGLIPGGLSATGLLIAKAGIMLVGTLLIHAIFAPPKTPSSENEKTSPTYTFSGQSNQPRRYARLPRIYGRHRYVADVAAMPYTVTVGKDTYLYALYSFGYGPLKLEDFRIGQNPLTNYNNYEIAVHENFTSSAQLTKYKSDVWQDSFNTELVKATPVLLTTQDDTERAVIDITFPQGLLYVNEDGNREFLTTDMDFEYRPLGGTDWTPIGIAEVSRGDSQKKVFVTTPTTSKIVLPVHTTPVSTLTGYVPIGGEPVVGQQLPGVGAYADMVITAINPWVGVGSMKFDGNHNWRPVMIEFSHGVLPSDVNPITPGDFWAWHYGPADWQLFAVGPFQPVDPPVSGYPAGTRTFDGYVNPGANPAVGEVMNVGSYALTVESIVPYVGGPATPQTPLTITFTEGLPGALPINEGESLQFMYTAVSVGSSRLHLNEKLAEAFTVSSMLVFPAPGQYELRISKVENDFPDDEEKDKHLWQRYVTAIKSMKSIPPLNPEVPITVVELVIKATGQLNGSIEQFSAIASSYLRQWKNGAWAVDLTRNPAWVYLDILQGSANNRPLPDNRIDMDAIKAWAIECDAIDYPFTGPRGTCDVVVDRQYTVWDLLQNIAATGRAAPTMRDNKYSILLDSPNRIPVQMFTPRNSRNLRSSRTYNDEPHALRVKWIDEKNNYNEAETVVYNTDRDKNNTTVFEDLQSFGMVRAEQVLRWGRYMFAQAKLRQERFTIEVDIENIVCVRGDLVLVAHDVIEVGGQASRVIEVEGARLFLDAPPSIAVDGDFGAIDPALYGVRIRRSDGYITGVLDVNAVGNDGEFDYIDLAVADPTITPDNLVVFGPKTQVVGEYVVDSIRPGANLAATIGLEELAPDVYTAEYAGLESLEYKPQGGGMLPQAVQGLQVTININYDINRVPMAIVRASWRPAQGLPFQPEDYRVWQITPTGNEDYLGATTGLFWEIGPIDLTTLNGYIFAFRVRPFYGIRGLGPAAEDSLTVEYVPRLAPPLVDNFDVQDLPSSVRRYLWSFNAGTPNNVAGIQVRYLLGNVAAPVWNNGTDLVQTGSYVVQNGDEYTSPLGAGTYTFMARTVDDKGQLSDGAFVLVRELTVQNAIDLSPPPTPTNFTAVGGFGIVAFTVDEASYVQGGGNAYTQVYGAQITPATPNPTFADATTFTAFQGTAATAGASAATTYRFWAKWVSVSNVESVAPAGPVDATTAINVNATMDALVGKLTTAQFTAALTSRINLIDAPSSTAGSVNERVLIEQTARISADTVISNSVTALTSRVGTNEASITSEQTTRANADATLTSSVNALTSRVGTAESNITTEQTTRANADTSLTNSLNSLTSRVGTNEASITSEQTARANGDAANASSITTLSSRMVSNPNMLPNGGLEFGAKYWTFITDPAVPYLSPHPAWGLIMYAGPSTAASGQHQAYSDPFPISAQQNYTFSADSQLIGAAGAPVGSYSVNVGIIFYNAAGTAVSNPSITRTDAHDFSYTDSNRLANKVTALSPVGATQARVRFVWTGDLASYGFRQAKFEPGVAATQYSQEVQVQQAITTQNGLSAQWTVKIDNNGYVSGFGLASTAGNAAASSTFAVRSDSFYIANPAGPGVAPAMPFIVQTVPTVINGQNVPVGVYMNEVFIRNGTIDSARIGKAVITDANIASLNADKINAGTVKAVNIDSRGLTIKDSAGNVIFSSGNTGINFDTYGRTNLNYAPSFGRPWTIAADVLPVVSGRGGGLQFSHDGYYVILNTPRGVYELAQSPPIGPIPGVPFNVSFYAYVNSGTGSRQVNADIVPGYGQVPVFITGGAIKRYVIPLAYDGVSSLSSVVIRLIGYAGPPVVIFDLQLEYGDVVTNWKPHFLDEVTPGNPMSAANVGTFMSNATIQTAQIGDLQVDTLKIANNAVTVPMSVAVVGVGIGGTVPVGTGTVVAKTGIANFPANAAVFCIATVIASNVPSSNTANCWLIMAPGGSLPANGQQVGGYGNPGTPPGGQQVSMSSVTKQTFSKIFTVPSAGDWEFALIVNTPAAVGLGVTCDLLALGTKK